LFLLLKWKWEPIDYNIKKGTKDADVLKMLPNLYHPKDASADKDEVFKQWLAVRRKEINEGDANAVKITFKESLFGAKYWKATWICFGMCCINQFSAIGPVCIYSS